VENELNDIDILISKVLADEASVYEQQIVSDWLLESQANRDYFNHLKLIFEKAGSAKVEEQFDEDAAWVQVKAKLQSNPKTKERSLFAFDWRIAAAIAAVVCVTALFYVTNDTSQSVITRVSANAKTKNDTLPDGSSVFLNKKSELTYSFDKKEKARKVKLSGEAFFVVKHEETQPFIIEADEIRVRDIGTEFNLKAYPDKDTIEIVVTEGEVQFYTLKNAGLKLKAGESARYLKHLKEFQRIVKPDTNVLAYKTKIFNFDNTDLKSVVKLLNEIYNTHIQLSPALAECRLTASFSEDNPNTIIEVIAETMGLTISRKEEDIVLEGTGCSTQ
jgi:transmembrane sensor